MLAYKSQRLGACIVHRALKALAPCATVHCMEGGSEDLWLSDKFGRCLPICALLLPGMYEL